MKNLYAILSVLLIVVGNLSAQPKGGQIDFAPAIGYYISTANVIEEGIGTSLAVEANHKSSLAFGGKLTIWANNMLGFETSFAYTSADLEGAVGGVEGSIGASLFFASEKVVLGFGNTSRFQIGGGFGIVSSSYDEFLEGGTHMIGVVGIAVIIPLSDNVGLRLDADDHIHRVYWIIDDFETDPITQNDIVVTLGISVSTGK